LYHYIVGDDETDGDTDNVDRVDDEVSHATTTTMSSLPSRPTPKPTTTCIEIIMRILSASRDRGMDRRVWSIFDTSQRAYDIDPTVDMYRSLIASLAKSRGENEGAAARAETLLREAATRFTPSGTNATAAQSGTEHSECVTLDMFHVVLVAWAKSGLEVGAQRAEQLITYMEEWESQHGNPGLIKPTIVTFTCLLDAYAQQNTWESAVRSEGILNRLVEQSEELGDTSLRPTVASWTIVMSVYQRLSRQGSHDAGERAYKLLKKMEKVSKPDAITYVTVMNALAFSKSESGPFQAEKILDDMYERYLDSDETMKPSAKSIAVIIDAFTRCTDEANAMDQAESFLDRYEDHLEAIVQDSPESISYLQDVYSKMLFGFSKAGDPIGAESYLQYMVERDMKPDPFCFDRVIECNLQMVDPDAFARISRVFELMEECSRKGDLQPNERLYTNYIRAMTKARLPQLAKRAYEVVERMKQMYAQGNTGIKPTVFTYNAVLNACAECATQTQQQQQQRQQLESDGMDTTVSDVAGTTRTEDSLDAFKIALSAFKEVRAMPQGPDHVSFGAMIRCANLLDDETKRDALIESTFRLCSTNGYVNTFVLRDLLTTARPELWQRMLGMESGDNADSASAINPYSVIDLQGVLGTLPKEWCRHQSGKPTGSKGRSSSKTGRSKGSSFSKNKRGGDNNGPKGANRRYK
jgi:pentatricopeptide repeat protein